MKTSCPGCVRLRTLNISVVEDLDVQGGLGVVDGHAMLVAALHGLVAELGEQRFGSSIWEDFVSAALIGKVWLPDLTLTAPHEAGMSPLRALYAVRNAA